MRPLCDKNINDIVRTIVIAIVNIPLLVKTVFYFFPTRFTNGKYYTLTHKSSHIALIVFKDSTMILFKRQKFYAGLRVMQ